jgi:soluble lytic murein transglycosylase-like protein
MTVNWEMKRISARILVATVSLLGGASLLLAQEAGGIDGLITKYSHQYQVPESLIRKIIRRESNYNPRAYHGGNWGLMQIRHATARRMGYRGPAKGLLDAETNLTFGVKYLRGAFLVADGNESRAVRYYSSGYYYEAKRKGLLEEAGMLQSRQAAHFLRLIIVQRIRSGGMVYPSLPYARTWKSRPPIVIYSNAFISVVLFADCLQGRNT